MNAARLRQALKELTDSAGALDGLHVFDELNSTNTWLLAQAPGDIGTAQAAIALHQTAGRGRLGKAWQAPAGSGLCLSVAFTYPSMPENASALTLALGVVVARAIEQLGSGEVMLKWPNDLVWQDQKLGGILVESNTLADGRFRVVAGIGINVALPADFMLESNSSSWAKGVVDLVRTGITPGIAELARAVIPDVVACLKNYATTSLQETVTAFNRRHWLRERPATLDGRMVRCEGVAGDGRLRVVDMLDGAQRDIDSADVLPLAWSDAS